MPDPSATSFPPEFGSQSSDQAASYPPQAYGRYDAPEGNAYAQGGYAAPNQAIPQDRSLAYADASPQQLPQVAPGQIPSYYSFDPYGQAAWDWSQPVDFTHLPTTYEPQGELIQELRDRTDHTNSFSTPLSVNPLPPPPRPLPQRPAVSPTMKRKSDAELLSMAQPNPSEQHNPPKRRAVSRTSSTASQSSPAPTALDAQPSPNAPTSLAHAAAGTTNPLGAQGSGETQRRKNASKGTGPQGREIDVSEPRRVVESSGSSDMLPAGRVFPIQIGSALFRLSGASLCSDAPSYFSHFFSEQLHNNSGRASEVRTLYIDRDPETFRDIALHLQGYHIVPRDGEHFVKLFADAQFYSLPRLTKQLFKSDIFISIGGTSFRIPRDTFSAPGDSPNYFSLGFAQWFSTPSEVFPGLDRNALLRPPSISPPSVPNKSGETFAELMKLLQGYDVEIRSEVHRANLLKDARYFHLKGLEQRLVPCKISYNLARAQSEILIRLEDIRQSGISFTPDPSPSPSPSPTGTVTYARPYTDTATTPHTLILETSSAESTVLHLPPAPATPSDPPPILAHATFHADTLRRITSLFTVVASKMGKSATLPYGLQHAQSQSQQPAPAPTGLAAGRIPVRLSSATALSLDGEDVELSDPRVLLPGGAALFAAAGGSGGEVRLVVRRAQWRVRVEGGEGGEEGTGVGAVLEGVRVEAFSGERGRNAERGFLGGG